MSKLSFDPHQEFLQFLENFNLSSAILNTEYRQTSKQLHKRALGLLVAEHHFRVKSTSRNTPLSLATSKYTEELRSDLLGGFLIFHIGLYKVSMMSARSGLENLFRVVAGSQGEDFSTIKSVFELTDLIKTTALPKQHSFFSTLLSSLISQYGELCNYTHSSNDDYLSLDRKLNTFPRWDPAQGKTAANSLLKLFQEATCTLLILEPKILHEMRHDQRDLILDALPMAKKAKLREIIN